MEPTLAAPRDDQATTALTASWIVARNLIHRRYLLHSRLPSDCQASADWCTRISSPHLPICQAIPARHLIVSPWTRSLATSNYGFNTGERIRISRCTKPQIKRYHIARCKALGGRGTRCSGRYSRHRPVACSRSAIHLRNMHGSIPFPGWTRPNDRSAGYHRSQLRRDQRR
jgi:hypothetical protein